MATATASKLLNFRDAIADARRRNGGDLRSFAAKINAAAGEERIATRSLLHSIERKWGADIGREATSGPDGSAISPFARRWVGPLRGKNCWRSTKEI